MVDAAAALGAIVNAGKGAWDIIKDNKAQSGAQSSFCSAVPQKIKFTKLSGWKNKSKSWSYTVKNLYGMECVALKLKYSFQYNGEAADIPGSKFVTNFSVWCESVKALWGYTVNVNATVKGKPINVGSKGKPVGAIPLLVTISTSTVLKSTSRTILLRAHGNGKLSAG